MPIEVDFEADSIDRPGMPPRATTPRPVRRAAAFALLVAVAVLPACARKQGDEERIRALVSEAARAAEEKRIGDVMRGVSDRFQGQGLDVHGLRQLVAFHALRGAWVAIRIAGDRVAVDGDTASAVADVVMIRSGAGRAIAELLPENAAVYRVALRLERTKDGWRVVTATWRPISLEDAAAGPGAATAP